jgi:GT2 family glycosyltransferase
MSKPSAEVTAVVVNWNSGTWTRTCLAHLEAQTVPVGRIILVDNGSTDGSVEWLRATPGIELIPLGENVGFAAANNVGIARCRSEFVLLVNPDVELASDYVERLLPAFADQRVGSVTGKLLRPGPARLIDSTGHNVYGMGWAENRGEELPDRSDDCEEEIFGVCAAAAAYRLAALKETAINGEVFDESYFAYIEDVDLDWRLRWLGWKAWYVPSAVGIHHRSSTRGRYTAPIMRHILKNRFLTVMKNYNQRMLVRNLPGIVVFTIIKTIDFARVHPEAALGLVDMARMGRAARQRGRAARQAGMVSGDEMEGWLKPFPWISRVRRRLRGSALAPTKIGGS